MITVHANPMRLGCQVCRGNADVLAVDLRADDDNGGTVVRLCPSCRATLCDLLASSSEPAGLTVGAVFSSHPIVEFFDDGRWWQMTADRRIRWWRADAIDGPRWSWWQQGATVDGAEHVPCRLVPLHLADASPETRGPIGGDRG